LALGRLYEPEIVGLGGGRLGSSCLER